MLKGPRVTIIKIRPKAWRQSAHQNELLQEPKIANYVGRDITPRITIMSFDYTAAFPFYSFKYPPSSLKFKSSLVLTSKGKSAWRAVYLVTVRDD